jgi:hypothetical protein
VRGVRLRADNETLRLSELWQSISRRVNELSEARHARASRRRAQRNQQLLETAHKRDRLNEQLGGKPLPPPEQDD